MAGDDIDGTGPTQANPAGDAPTDLASGVTRRADAPDSLLGGVLAGRYRIDRRLGSGGMGAVYAGTHLLLDRPIAVKIIKPRFGDDPGIAQRFIQEARAASGIGHPHVVEITDFGETEGGTAYFVMERLEGEDLADTVTREGPLAWPRVVHISEQIARALAAAHKHGVVHRDIKPANCFRLTRDDDPDYIKVLDFGLAKVVGSASRAEQDASLTQTGALLGTPGYIAPELYRGLSADHRVDIYALGALMHKLLTGELPPMRLGSDGPSELSLAAVPPGLQAILRRALADEPAARYPTAQALAVDLRHLAAGTGVSLDPGSEPPAASGPLLAVTHDARGISFTIGAPLLGALVLGLGLFAFFSLRAGSLPPADPAGVPVEPARITAEPGPPVIAAAAAPPTSPSEPPTVEPPTPASPDVLGPNTHEPASPGETTAPATTSGADEPEPRAALPKGSPAAVQKAIRRRCAGTFGYTVKLQWKADADGHLIPGSVKVLGTPQHNDAESCALRQLVRSELAWTPGETYAHAFKSG
ncbi:serine/threonine-protein kinase [Nannocystis bainbridge]|uniref:Serine/threonine-protein kinase n=1 Tax=Nannocystis bainbridge TaxID=2995303 RepID=A0ABT5DQR8_9BACT|nr:serine/threonine-protein kinase [Nannocystis bainbridge]MDC0715490.1 serine/threonine-protein kinase [Nannocystis bainbridge]